MGAVGEYTRIKGRGRGFPKGEGGAGPQCISRCRQTSLPRAHVRFMCVFYTLLLAGSHRRCLRLPQRFFRERSMIGSALQRSFRCHLTTAQPLQNYISKQELGPKSWGVDFHTFCDVHLSMRACGSRNPGGALTILLSELPTIDSSKMRVNQE